MFNKLINLIQSQWKLFLLGMVIASTLVLFFNQTPRLVSSSPTTDQQNVDLSSDITLVFDRSVNPQKFEFGTSPAENFKVTADGEKITLSHDKSFYQNTQYTLDIYYNRAKISIINFKTMPAQSNPRDLQAIQKKVEEEYPLYNKLPYSTSTYQVVYIEPKTLRVELYESGLDQSTITKQINAWITSQGIDPKTHTLVFQEPSHPSPTTYH